jgi:lipoate-protein ligase A
MAQELRELRKRVSELEEAIVQVVASIDETDGSRVNLQATLDSTRETFFNVYGEDLGSDVDEYLSTFIVEEDEEDEEDEENDENEEDDENE